MKDNWLYDRLRLLKGIVFQYLQQLKNNPNAECSILSNLSQINAKISELKDSVTRIEKIKCLSEEIEKKKEEYYKKCKKLIDHYNEMEVKLNEVNKELENSSKCRKISLRELLLYSFRISGTSSAPSNWNYADSLPLAFRPPAPQEHEIRATKLFETDNLERTPKPVININKLQNHNHVSIAYVNGSIVRYTIDGSLPSDLTGKIYDQPFIVPAEADFIIKAVAFMDGKKESEVASSSVQGGSLALPGRIEHVAERPDHIVTNAGQPLSLGLEVSPYSSSRYSSDDDNEYIPPFT